MARTRISLKKEDRIAELYRQGYRREEIAAIVNNRPGSIRVALKRFGRRWKYSEDDHYGRRRNFFSDAEIEDIRNRYCNGEPTSCIAADYKVDYRMIYNIVTGRTYNIRESDGFPFDFVSRPNRRLL
jgi:hypothetical protein